MKKKLIKKVSIGLGVLVLLLVAVLSVTTKKDANASALITKNIKENKGKVKIGNCDIMLKADFKSDCVIYTGKEVEPEITIMYKGKTLVKDEDYTVIFFDNKEKGRAHAKITGIGNYFGSVEEYFSIASLWIDRDCDVNVVDDKLVVYFGAEIIDSSEYRVIKFDKTVNKKGQIVIKYRIEGCGFKVDGCTDGKIVKLQ